MIKCNTIYIHIHIKPVFLVGQKTSKHENTILEEHDAVLIEAANGWQVCVTIFYSYST